MPLYETSFMVPASLAPPVQITQGTSMPGTYTNGQEFILTVTSGSHVPGLYVYSSGT